MMSVAVSNNEGGILVEVWENSFTAKRRVDSKDQIPEMVKILAAEVVTNKKNTEILEEECQELQKMAQEALVNFVNGT